MKKKVTDKELKDILLARYIDNEGNKVSDRTVWGDLEFMKLTGMFKLNKYTNEKEAVSLGTVSYWKKKLGIKEYDIFEYGKDKGLIGEDVEFERWSNHSNKGKKRTRNEATIFNPETVKLKLIQYYELSESYAMYDLEKIESSIVKLFDRMGLDGKEELKEFYEKLKKGGLK